MSGGFRGFIGSVTVNDGSGDGNLFAPVAFGGDIELGLALFFWTVVVGVSLITSLVAFCILELPQPGIKPGKSNSCYLPWPIVGFLLGYVLLSWKDGEPVGYLSFFVERHDLIAIFFAGNSFFELQTLLRCLKLMVTTATMFAISMCFTYLNGDRVVIIGSGQSLGNTALSYAMSISAGMAAGFACRYTLIASQHHGAPVQVGSAIYLFFIAVATLYTSLWIVQEKVVMAGSDVPKDAIVDILVEWGYTLAIVFAAQQPFTITMMYWTGQWLYSSSRKVFELDKILFDSQWWKDFRTREAARKFKKGGLARMLRMRGSRVASEGGPEGGEGADDDVEKAGGGLAEGISIPKLETAESLRVVVRPPTPPIVITDVERQLWYISDSEDVKEELKLPEF